MRCVGEALEQLDRRLVSLAREEAALRLRLGQVLEVLGRGRVFDLGFSSLSAYGLERCARGTRWVEGARCLARRVEELPRLRQALVSGEVSWSMAELLTRVAQPEDEARWLEAARSRTVRQMRVAVAYGVSRSRAVSAAEASDSASASSGGVTSERGVAGGGGGEAHGGDTQGGEAHGGGVHGPAEEMCTLTCTVAQEDAWLFEATRSLLDHMGVRDANEQSEALLAEAQTTLLSSLPEGVLDPDRWQGRDAARQRCMEELGRWRVEAEVLCEPDIASGLADRMRGPKASGRRPTGRRQPTSRAWPPLQCPASSH